MGHKHFHTDLKIAKGTEADVAVLLKERFDVEEVYTNDTIDYDLWFPYNGRTLTFEVKEDFECMNSGNVCVEYWCRGKPSGIDATKALYFIYKVHLHPRKFEYYICKTNTVRRMIADEVYHRVFTNKGDPNSGTCGYLFRLTDWRKFATLIET